MNWIREIIYRQKAIRDLREALDGLSQRLWEFEHGQKRLDRDMDDLEAYVKKVLGRVTGGIRREEKDAPEGPDINEQIREGKLGTLRVR